MTNPTLSPNWTEVSSLFDLRANFIYARPYGSGHINDTFCADYDQAGLRIRYIHQRINHRIFKDPVRLMENIKIVTEHVRSQQAVRYPKESYRRALTIINAHTGLPYAQDSRGNYWRTYQFIERARTYDKIESIHQAKAAAKAFGEFQRLSSTIDATLLTETIPDFHHTPKRLERFKAVLEKDTHNRASGVKDEIAFVLNREADCNLIVDHINKGTIPVRITHNDTKLNNVMIDDVSGEGVCVIDLDTVMPGSVLYDFGDMVRAATNSALEDEKDVGKVHMQMDMFEALVEGYLESANDFLNDTEKELLAFSGKLLSLECGIRFLTDYLEGDVYFKTSREGHNLDRCRTQFALISSIEKQLDAMNAVIKRHLT